MNNKLDYSTLNLMSTLDALEWAKEFMRLHGGKLQDIDEALMHTWFASAIMTGRDLTQQPERSEDE